VANSPLLLEALAPLSCLRHLDLRGIYRTGLIGGRVAEPAKLSRALADKPHLTYLDLGQNRIFDTGAPIEPGANLGTALMVPPWQLPALQVRFSLWKCCKLVGGRGPAGLRKPCIYNAQFCCELLEHATDW
jgi:hypothetical protein